VEVDLRLQYMGIGNWGQCLVFQFWEVGELAIMDRKIQPNIAITQVWKLKTSYVFGYKLVLGNLL